MPLKPINNTDLFSHKHVVEYIGVSLTVYGNLFSDRIGQEFFQAVGMSVLLYSCTNWALMEHLQKKLDRNYTRILSEYPVY